MAPVIHRPALPIPLPLARGGLAATTAAGGRTTLGLGSVALEDYEEGTFTMTATGFSGTAPSGTATYVLVGRAVTLIFPDLVGTSNATNFDITGLPAGIQASVAARCVCAVKDNNVHKFGILQVLGGTIGVYSGVGFAAWTASGEKLLYGPVVPYVIA